MSLQQPLPSMEAIAVRQPTIDEMIVTAIERGAPVETIERFVALRQQLDAKRAEEEFNEAMNKCQSEMQVVRADCENPQTKSKYASYAALDRALRPIYTKFGFAISYSTTDCPLADHVRVLAYATRGGHTRIYQCDISADGKGAKGNDVMSKTHASGSAMSYGMRYLLKMIFNVAIGEEDTDGNGSPKIDLAEKLEWIQNCRNLDELQRTFSTAYSDAYKLGDKLSMDRLIKAKDARKKELNEGR